MDNKFFEIELLGEATLITNHSEYLCIFSYIPTSPKLKYIDRLVVKPKQCVIPDYPIDITKYSIRFEEDDIS